MDCMKETVKCFPHLKFVECNNIADPLQVFRIYQIAEKEPKRVFWFSRNETKLNKNFFDLISAGRKLFIVYRDEFYYGDGDDSKVLKIWLQRTENATCAICLEEVKDGYIKTCAECGSFIHVECFKESLEYCKEHGKMYSCPLCRFTPDSFGNRGGNVFDKYSKEI